MAQQRDRKEKQEKIAAPQRPKVHVTREAKSGVVYIDYKDTESLKRMISANGKILGRKRTGSTAMEQRMLASAVKRARFMSLLPHVGVIS